MQANLGTNRNYCFTAWQLPVWNPEVMKYMIYGKEICPTTGRLHYQGYVELKSPSRVVACKKYFKDNTIHLEKRKGTRDQAITYCKKDGDFLEYVSSSNSLTKEDKSRRDECDRLLAIPRDEVLDQWSIPLSRTPLQSYSLFWESQV